MGDVWQLLSPHSVVYTVRGESALRELCAEDNLSYDKLAKHIGHKKLGAGEKRPPPHVKGWRHLPRAQWLQRGAHYVCVVGTDAKAFISFINSSSLHPMHGVFGEVKDRERLVHLLNNGWIWSNNVKVSHMHGWHLLTEAPERPERFLTFIQKPSIYAPDDDVRSAPVPSIRKIGTPGTCVCWRALRTALADGRAAPRRSYRPLVCRSAAHQWQ